ncbi:MAG: hypothetical protein IT434_10025 [Phycisphaerales bacterium]|nr:hypothetical protein [Phycisphaerales bacterium]
MKTLSTLSMLAAILTGTQTNAAVISGLNLHGLGNGVGYDGTGWNTHAPDGAWNLYLYKQGLPVNSGDGPSTSILLDLAPGIHAFTFHAASAYSQHRPYAFNVFADGNNHTPVISARSRVGRVGDTDQELDPFAGTIASLDYSSTLAGANALSWITADGTERVELVDLGFFAAESDGADLVAGYDSLHDGLPDQTGQFTLRVTAIPAPATLTFALLAAIVRGRRPSRQAPAAHQG